MNQTAAKKNKSKVSATTVLLIALLVIAALILVWTLVDRIGLPGRFNTVAKTDNYELSANQLALLKYQEAYSSLYYNCLYYSYGMTSYASDIFGDLAYYKGYPDAYALDHMINYLSIMSDDGAYTTAKNILVYCEGADKAGFEITAEKREEAEKNMGAISLDTLKAAAKGYDKNLSSFLNQYVGAGVSKGDVEKLTDMYVKAQLYAEHKGEELEDAVTEKEAEEFRDRLENKGSFFFTEYISCKLPSKTWVTDKVMESAKECKTLDELKELLLKTILEDQMTDSVLDTNFKDNDKVTDAPKKEDGSIDKDKIKADLLASLLYRAELSEDKTAFDEAWDTEKKENKSDVTLADGYVKVGDELVAKMYKEAKTTVITLEETDGKTFYADPTDKDATDLQKWLFGDEGRKEGDVTVIKTETTNSSSSSSSTSTKTTTYTWYCIEDGDRILVFDTEKTKDGYYVELKDDTAPKDGETETDATTGEVKEVLTKDEKYALIEAAKDLAARKEVFENKLSSSERTNLTESTLEGVGEELAAWFYSGDRKEGDYARITVGEGDDAKEYAVLFTKENDETWLINAKSGLASERLTEWFDEMVVACHYKADYEPATETETETEAATSSATTAATEAATTAPESTTETTTEGKTETESEDATEPESESAAA